VGCDTDLRASTAITCACNDPQTCVVLDDDQKLLTLPCCMVACCGLLAGMGAAMADTLHCLLTKAAFCWAEHRWERTDWACIRQTELLLLRLSKKLLTPC